MLGRVREAAEAADQAEQGARLTGSAQAVQWTLWMRAWTLLERGDLDAALVSAQESVALTEGLDESVLAMIARAVLGAVLVARGDHERGREMIARYDADPRVDLPVDPLARRGRSGARRHARGRRSRGAGGRAGADAGARRRARRVGAGRRPGGAGTGRRGRGGRSGARRGGGRRFRRRDAGRRARPDPRRPRAGAGDRDAAVAALEDARARAEGCGADRVRDEAVRELRRLGRRVGRGGARAAEGGGLAGLTGREREIADLVAAGLTNRQIGARIHLSEKTVETHLSRVFAKLGVRKRSEVAALVAGATRGS